MSKKKKFTILLLFNIFIILGMLYAFEGYLRLSDPLKQYSPDGKVGNTQYTMGRLVTNNRWGFRERNIEAPKPKGVYRIMVLGDSLTWGVGLSAEERYTVLLENTLNKEFPDKKFGVINFGLPGIPTVQERDILMKYQDAVDPDMIVVGFCYNDPQIQVPMDAVNWKNVQRSSHAATQLFQAMNAMGLKYTSKRIKKALYRIDEMQSRVPAWEVTIQHSYEEGTSDWTEFKQALRDIKAVSDKRGLPTPIFAVLDSGVYRDRPTDYSHPDEPLQRRLGWYHKGEKAAAQLGFRTFNYEKEIASEFVNESLAVNVLDAHPSAKLNRLYARKLAAIISEQLQKK